MEKIDISKFEQIVPSRGGVKGARWTLSKATEIIRINKYAIDEDDIWEMNFIEIKVRKENNKIIVLFIFSENKDDLKNPFSVGHYQDDKNNRSLSFSCAGIFRKFSMKAKNVLGGEDKSILLKINVQEQEGKKYFISEIPITNHSNLPH